ncbi:MAG TPA: hypothetical protein VNT02_13720, partial [Burkholderiales bacterium]|nr:hypothetical protein [Burkholderiales bacterium]
LTVSRAAADTRVIDFRLTGEHGKRWLRHAARRLSRLLADSHASLTLRIEALQNTDAPSIDYLLDKLARYGDRVSIVIDRNLGERLRVDSSVFHLVLRES